MKRSQLEDQIKKRANSEVQQQIQQCKVAVYSAIDVLLTGTSSGYPGRSQYLRNKKDRSAEMQAILDILAGEDNGKGWPTSLWTKAEERLTNTMLSKMDELQRILFAKDSGTDEGEPANKDADQ